MVLFVLWRWARQALAERGSAVPSLVANLLKSLPFQQPLSEGGVLQTWAGGAGPNGLLSGEGGGRECEVGGGPGGTGGECPPGDRPKERQGQKSGRAKGRKG